VGLGHLVRVACLKHLLDVPSRILGPVDAAIGADGIALSRQRRADAPPAVWVVDRPVLPREVIAHKLDHRDAQVLWVRRGLYHPGQALIQAGFLDFVDRVLVPDEVVPQQPDAVEELAAAQGKLVSVGICHAYEAAGVAVPDRPEPFVFLSLGNFEPPHRRRLSALRRQLVQQGIAYRWSAYGVLPLLYGFAPRRRVPLAASLGAKARAAAKVSEAGYNNLLEALHVGRPALFFANETRGREAQQARIALAKAHSPLVFDGLSGAETNAFVSVAGDTAGPRRVPEVVAAAHGLRTMSDLISGSFHARFAVGS
jgi:hypothetical protein